jgi:hypothetical protein
MIIIMPIISILITIIAFFWVSAIEKSIKYYKDNPEADPNSGWLDWDIKKDNFKNKNNKI